MERLWAPWRLSYVSGPRPTPGQEPCFLCEGLAASEDRKNLIAARREHCVVVLNRYPYNNGHLLVAPRAHKAKLQELTAEEHLEMQAVIAELIDLYDRLIRPDGYNV